MPKYESPFEGHPGTLEFPDTFNGKLYKKWASARARQDDDVLDGVLQYEAVWRAVRAIGTVRLEGLDSLEFDDIPLDVVRWCRDQMDDYLAPFLALTPWRRPPGDT